jgi:hypothetical protein
MIALLTSRFDDELRVASQDWSASEKIVLVTLADLLSAGWQIRPGAVEDSMMVASGVMLPAGDLSLVVNLLPQVHDFELLSIRKADRQYVAAELFAFLVWWLRILPCPVMNRPTPGCLTGPSWNLAQWFGACKRVGIPGEPPRRHSAEDVMPVEAGLATASTVVVGRQVLGSLYPRECLALASIASTHFLEVLFEERGDIWAFRGVNPLPNLFRPTIREAVWQCAANPANDKTRHIGVGIGA